MTRRADENMNDQVRSDIDSFLERLSIDPLKTVVEFYSDCLTSNSKALDYLRRNALFVPGLEETNRLLIGFADRSLGKRVPKKIIKVGWELRSKLAEVGVYRANGREHFRGMLTLPLWSFDEREELGVSGIYGLRIDLSNGGESEYSIGSGLPCADYDSL